MCIIEAVVLKQLPVLVVKKCPYWELRDNPEYVDLEGNNVQMGFCKLLGYSTLLLNDCCKECGLKEVYP